jgi:lauroyl/myristoyl acyltransferase
MSLSRFIQSQELLSRVALMQPDELKSHVTELTVKWYKENPEARALIESNLDRLGIINSPEQTDSVIEHTGLHYFEKLLPLCLGTRRFFEFLQKNIDMSSAVSILREAQSQKKPVLCATPHFGAVEFITPALASQGFPLSAVLRFTTEKFSQQAHAHAQAFTDSGLFAAISFIEIGKPGVPAALEMAAVLRRQGILMSVFDEETEYSIPARIFNAELMGGAGLHKLVAFCGADPLVLAAFMVRLDNGKYRLYLETADGGPKEAVQAMYNRLDNHAKINLEQWYFLHEEIPFCGLEEK